MTIYQRHSFRRAFSLIEILMVVTLIGVLAAIVIPKFSNASELARQTMLADNLRMLRMQVSVFRAQHMGVSPGYPGCDVSQAPTEAALSAQLTRASDADGGLADPGTDGYIYGPYINSMLENPVNGKVTVQIIGDAEEFPDEGDNSHGYVYQPSTLTLRPDNPGLDENGKSFWDY